MDVESVALDVPIKQDVKDDIAMPPPVAPVPSELNKYAHFIFRKLADSPDFARTIPRTRLL